MKKSLLTPLLAIMMGMEGISHNNYREEKKQRKK